MHTLDEINVTGKTCLLRVDFNVPFTNDGKRVLDDSRLKASLATVRELIDKRAKIVLMTHIGRPHGKPKKTLAVATVRDEFANLLGQKLVFVGSPSDEQTVARIQKLRYGAVAILENLRFDRREESNDTGFAKLLARLGDIYVNDAFAVSHRRHSSIDALARLLPSFAGRSFQKEIEGLGEVVHSTIEPSCAILGGDKVADKIRLIENLRNKFTRLLIGGNMTASFIAAQGYASGANCPADDDVETARQLLKNIDIVVPDDVLVDDSAGRGVTAVGVESIQPNQLICDIGPKTSAKYTSILCAPPIRRVVWNGPMGMFEDQRFAHGTISLCKALGELPQETLILAGGGSTAAAIKMFGIASVPTHLSTAGGAFLEYLEGVELPGITALNNGQRI